MCEYESPKNIAGLESLWVPSAPKSNKVFSFLFLSGFDVKQRGLIKSHPSVQDPSFSLFYVELYLDVVVVCVFGQALEFHQIGFIDIIDSCR